MNQPYAYPDNDADPGMTLRDYFAAAALTGIAAADNPRTSYKDDAEGAYQYADAMIAAREKGGDNGEG